MVGALGLASVEALLAALAGEALGAAIGAYPALSVAGLVIVAGEAVHLAGGDRTLTALVGLGPAFGPHVAFAGGVAATAYAARRGYLDTDFAYHEAKHVTAALGTRPDVLLVGAAFGLLGHVLARVSATSGIPVDPVMASIVVSGFVHRIVLGYPLIGTVRGGLLDMSPFERGERRAAVDGGTATLDRDDLSDRRYAVEPWLPHQYEWGGVAVSGLFVGLFAAFLSVRTSSPFLAFGIAAATLLFLDLEGDGRVPVTHHMALPAGLAALGVAGMGTPVALVAGGLFGLLSGVVAELGQRTLYAHADTHLDPSALGIVVTTGLLGVLSTAGLVQLDLLGALGY
ncbi:hypothetical protein BRC83_08555 [Halobacteriales archaeon QS_1_68_17]|nr:MAG: hypothetical protein BRC83_08555 [Halobacteriales archaeon QS_1_68_17]